MKILNAGQIRKVDAYTIEHEPVKSIDLMERAASQCVLWIKENLGDCLSIKIFVGPGNNGGDGLAIARLLAQDDNVIEVFMLTLPENLSPDARTNYERLAKADKVTLSVLEEDEALPEVYEHDIVIDALYGSGLTRPLSGLAASIVKHINKADVTVVAIDLPSGLFAEANTYEDTEAIIKAYYTLSFQVPKLSFFFPENMVYVGNWHVLDIGLLPEAIEQQQTKYYTIQNEDVAFNLRPRNKFSHKGDYGHALLMAGSYGKMGAAVLASKACLRAGVGLLTAHISAKGYEIIQTTVPEAMVSIDPGPDYLSIVPELHKYNAVGIGPGIGTNDYTGFMLQNLLKSANLPMVLDADALNLIALHQEWLDLLPVNSILTPHPGEFDRLVGSSKNGYDRIMKQIQFSQKQKIIVVLKGANTSITDPDGNCWFNCTGNPGMATAGSGDVLTGIVLSLLAQGYQPLQAALAGVYIHGMAGDLACEDTGVEALLSSDIINYIGKAFMTIRSNEMDIK
jgi:NAD(P)H-hydrate epimerase